MTSFDVLDAEMERLKSMSGGGSSLEPILRGFHDAGFQAAVQQFAADRAAHFQATCPDGSQPLIWTQYFNEYRELFEMHLRHILHGLGLTQDTFHELCGYLQEIEENLGDDSENLYGYIKAITSSEDYDAFLQLMFAEVQRQQSLGAGTSQEIEVVVPEGMGPGETLPVDYLGARYELVIPEGYTAGMTFRTSILV
ncbi:unnamed protein product [Symbiodinium necroappetens]|uniref:BART domain-containing protein n=2 Tax=Symbiodinium TaxID=2949 RepID=A0A812VM36_9DINO|nr:hypothetical protein AK812_SmicGene38858 [Symbiodinium microadriaticum]CAE7241180.1 unnamed protein product [Symbiodinium sp. KB8]CAE7632001.1 unnamed protein product [Symbiodinium necroappetens]